MTDSGELSIGPLVRPADGSDDTAKVVADLVNSVYAVAEDGMWPEGATRTSATEIAELAGAGQLFVASLGDRIVGCVKVVQLDARTAEFGMLAADPEVRGAGIGRALVRFAEAHAARLGNEIMQLEIIQPKDFEHPSKVFLSQWYPRMGYVPVRTEDPEVMYPELVPLLAVPCDVVVYHKRLG
ncbi:GNAT family N-acetyltransferase [Rhodococcus ruber]|nr:GNAT family N-acetyltransferase [Rhodococcus ruber]